MEKEASRRTEAVSVYNNIGKELILLLQTEFEFVDDHRAGKIVVELNGRLNKCGVISLRIDIGVKDIEGWTARLLPSRQYSENCIQQGIDINSKH
nr:40S ribosomal protein S15a-1 [Ipomoea batatas]